MEATEPLHSKYSASAFEAAMLCPGKPVMERGMPDNGSAYSREGTAAHELLELCLLNNQDAAAYEGRIFNVPIEGTDKTDPVLVDDDMVRHIQWCLNYVRGVAGDNAIMAETSVNYSDDIGVERHEGWGTADIIVPNDDALDVMDLKYGMGVEVDPAENPQMMLYGLGALRAVDGILGDFETVRLHVLQPRLGHEAKVWEVSAAELRAWAAGPAWEAVDQRKLAEWFGGGPKAFAEMFLHPGEKQCKFCKAKATCPKLRDEVALTVFNGAPAAPSDFDQLEPLPTDGTAAAVISDSMLVDADFTEAQWLSSALSKVDLIEDWCKAIRARAEHVMLTEGCHVPGFKIVQGKKGNRAWTDEKAVTEVLKSMRLKDEVIFDFKLKSPTQIAKLGPPLDKNGNPRPLKEGEEKPVIGARQWKRVAELITQADGKLHVAPESDKREAVARQPIAEQFDPPSETLPTNPEDFA